MPQSSESLHRPEKPASQQRANILLVDDQPANLQALAAILDDLGHNLISAGSGEVALQRLLAGDFALVLLDVQMPHLNGFETAKLIRGQDKAQQTPIIFLTAYEDDLFSVEEAYALGAVDYLVKPVLPVVLRAKVAGFVDLYRKAEQVRWQAEQLRQMERHDFDRRLAEENMRLQESEQRFRTLASFAPVGIFQTDAKGNCLFVNDRWCEMAGLSPEQAQNQGWVRALHPEDRECIAQAWYEAAEAGREFASEYRFQTPQGNTTWLHCSAVALRDDAGQVIGHIGTVTDISERKQAEDCLRASAAQLRLVTDHAPVFIAHCDKERRFKFVNRGYAERLGLTAREIVGKPLPEVLGEKAYESFRQYVDQVLNGAEVEFEVEIPYERIGPHVMRCAYVPEKDDSGQVVGWVAVISDITDRRRAEEDLRRHKERLELAQQAGRIGTFDWNIQTDEVEWSAIEEEIFGLPAGGFGGRLENWKQMLHPDDRDRAVADCLRAVENRADLNTEFRILRPDGKVRWITGQGKIYSGDDGRLRMVGVNVDFTERKEAEQALAEADRRRDELLAMLAHELRNPLAPIRYALQIIKLSEASAEMIEQSREMMERQVQHLVHLVDDLLDISRITRGQIELRRERVQLATVIARAVETSRPLIDAEAHELIVSGPPEPLWLDGDLVRLAQVVTNLLNNAARYTERRGMIWLAAERDGTEAVIRVRDTGVGIPPEILPHIFDLFVQGDRRTKDAQGGLGIGLALVRKLVELHGGTVRASSDGLGRGSEFVVRLPAWGRHSETESASRADGALAPSHGKRQAGAGNG